MFPYLIRLGATWNQESIIKIKSMFSDNRHLGHSGAEFRKFVIRKLLVDNLGDNPDDLPVYSRLLKGRWRKLATTRRLTVAKASYTNSTYTMPLYIFADIIGNGPEAVAKARRRGRGAESSLDSLLSRDRVSLREYTQEATVRTPVPNITHWCSLLLGEHVTKLVWCGWENSAV